MSDYVTKEELRHVLEAFSLAELDARPGELCLRPIRAAIDRLAALSPAKACSGFVCEGWIDSETGCRRTHSQAVPEVNCIAGDGEPECTCTCGQPFSAHQQEPAPQPANCRNCDHDVGLCRLNEGHPCNQQPAPSALPTMIESIEANGKEWVRKSVFEAYQRECERLRGENALLRDDGNAAVHEAAVWMDKCHAAEQRAEQTEAALAQARAEERERCAKAFDDLELPHCAAVIRALGGEAGE